MIGLVSNFALMLQRKIAMFALEDKLPQNFPAKYTESQLPSSWSNLADSYLEIWCLTPLYRKMMNLPENLFLTGRNPSTSRGPLLSEYQEVMQVAQ